MTLPTRSRQTRARAVAVRATPSDRAPRAATLFLLAAALLLGASRVAGAQGAPHGLASAHAAIEATDARGGVIAGDGRTGVAPHAAAPGARSVAAEMSGPVAAPSALTLVGSRPASAATRDEHRLSLDEERRRRREGSGLRRNIALIGVGVAAIIVGDAVDDAPGRVLEIGGAGLVLYGAYRILAGS